MTAVSGTTTDADRDAGATGGTPDGGSAPAALRFRVRPEFHPVPLDPEAGAGAGDEVLDERMRDFARAYWGEAGEREPLRAFTAALYGVNSARLAADGTVYHALGFFPVGGSAVRTVEEQGMRAFGVVGGRTDAVRITADTFKDRLGVAVARHFGDANLYRAASGRLGGVLDHVVPQLVESTPLGRIPALADSVRSVADDAGDVRRYVAPRSWTARGYEAVTGAHHLYKEGVRHVTEDIRYGSEEFHESVDTAREKAGELTGRLAAANPFG